MPELVEVASFLDDLLVAARFRGMDDPCGILRGTDHPLSALGLCLEPASDVASWIERERLDALFVHRPWHLPWERLNDVGVLGYHLAFDERLTLGYNPPLAGVLGMTEIETLGRKQGRPLGMLGDVPEREVTSVLSDLEQVFGGFDEALVGNGRPIRRLAVVGAMTAPLVHEAAERGADLYVTGQMRVPAREAVRDTDLPVVAVGHRRSEVWGLHALRGALRDRWPDLRLVVRA